MKIKHFQGYGCVNAKKVLKEKNRLVVEVRGEHEYGLSTDDKYTVFDWLVRKFDKNRNDYIEISKIDINEDYIKKPSNYSGYEEICTYDISFRD